SHAASSPLARPDGGRFRNELETCQPRERRVCSVRFKVRLRMAGKVSDRGIRSAKGAGRVRLYGNSAEAGVERVIDQELAREALAKPQNLLEDFEGLQRTHHPGRCPKDAGLRTGGSGAGRGWLREEAAVARPGPRPVEGPIGRKLPVKFGNRRRNQRFPGKKTGVIEQKTGREI